MDDDFINKLVNHRCGQLGKIGVLLGKGKKLFHTGGIFRIACQAVLGFGNRNGKAFLLGFVFREQAVKAFICDAPDSKGFVELLNDDIKLRMPLAVFVQFSLRILCGFCLSDLGCRTDFGDKFLLIGNGKGTDGTDSF